MLCCQEKLFKGKDCDFDKNINRRFYLSDSNGIRTHNHLVLKRTLQHLAKLASLAKWLSVRLGTQWLWVRIPLLSL